MNATMENLGWTLVHSLWQWTLVALVAGALVEAFRRRSASARYLALVVAMFVGGMLPVVTWSLLVYGQMDDSTRLAPVTGELARDERTARSGAVRQTSDADARRGDEIHASSRTVRMLARRAGEGVGASDERVGVTAAIGLQFSPQSRAFSERLTPWFPWLVGCWGVGVTLGLLRPALGYRTLSSWKRTGVSPATSELRSVLVETAWKMGVTRSVQVLQSSVAGVPVVLGYFKPVILLPVAFVAQLPPAQIEALLAHELAHVRRHDFAINLLQMALETLFFYHPVVWWLSGRIRVEREHCCDDLVVARLSNRVEYGRALVAIEQLRANSPRLALGAGDGSLLARIRRLVEGDAAVAPRRPTASVTLAALLLAGLALPTLWAGPERRDDEARQPRLAAVDGAPARRAVTSEWSVFGGSLTHNQVAQGRLPRRWEIPSKQNVRWQSPLGHSVFSSPTVAGGKVFVGSSQGKEFEPAIAPDSDVALLLCFDEQTGSRLWHYTSERRTDSREYDWPDVGLSSTACVDGDRVFVMTNRCEIVCLDVDGFRDGENDGEVKDETSQNESDADVVWKFDLIRSLGVRPLHQPASSVVVVDDLALVHTSNAPDESFRAVAAPQAPQFVALRASTGELVWQDASGSDMIAAGGSACGCAGPAPAVARIGDVTQAIFAGRDGWLYAFDFESLKRGSSKQLWKFDCNPKRSSYGGASPDTRNTLLAAPVVVDDRVYVATGRNSEEGEGPGDLWCIDATKRGDLSSELVFNSSFREGREPIAHKALLACDEAAGDFTRPNPQSGAIWHYVGADLDGDGKRSIVESFHRTIGTPVVDQGLLFIADFSGILHCVDARTGRGLWTRDLQSSAFASCLIADGLVVVPWNGDELTMFKVARTCEPVRTGRMSLRRVLHATPTFVNDTLYVALPDRLVAIREDVSDTNRARESPDRNAKE